MPLLYMDCSRSGLSGDMMVSVLQNLGVPAEKFQAIADSLKSHLAGTEKISVSFSEVPCNGIQASFLKMELNEQSHHRSVNSLEKALKAVCLDLKLSSMACNLANSIFSLILNAESKIHGIEPNAVHLHELASADTLFDAIGVAMGLDSLSLLETETKISASSIAVGGGSVKIAHGIVSVPAPATTEIMQQTDLILQGGPIDRELLTPTGAAILAALKVIPANFLPPMKIRKIGRGAGNLAKEGTTSPVVVYLGEEPDTQEGAETVTLLETNLDDVPGEYVGHALERILDAGALDAYISPILMKKSRPASVFHVLCIPSDAARLTELIFAETGTLGVRVLEHYRICIPREIHTVTILVKGKEYQVHVKIARANQQYPGFKPEYEDLARISKEVGISVQQLAKIVIAEYLKQIPPRGEK